MEYRHDYLIVGAGMAGEAAAQALHDADPDASIGMIGNENQPPYDRPPLSKGLWKGDEEKSIFRPLDKTGAILFSDRAAVAIDAQAHRIKDSEGDTHVYRKLLLATGGTPRTLDVDSDRLIHFRTLDDYHRLRRLAVADSHIAVIGGGFIGSELAASLAAQDVKVSLIFPEDYLGERIYPIGLADFLSDYYREHGIELLAGRRVRTAHQSGDKLRLKLNDGSEIDVDAAVAGLGITPNTSLAEQAGASVDNGVVVDDCMRTSVPDIHAAGDVAAFPNQDLGRRIRFEHENCAITTGYRAGLTMAGRPEPYTELPFFYSDLFDLGYEAVGLLDARLEIAEDWRVPHREGVVYYLDDGRVRGVLLWNTWGQVDAARKLIADPGPHDADSLRGRIRG
ncbi:MAG: FAD/NAD(P)-binding oxidoreductase [Rhodanobacteraceae bacterium]